MAYVAGTPLGAAAENGSWTDLTYAVFTAGTIRYHVFQSGTMVEIKTTSLLSGSIANNTIYVIVAAASLPSAIKPASGYVVGGFFTGWAGGRGEALLSPTDGLQIRQTSGGTLTANMALSFIYSIG
jgi:hypothetical protein